MSSLKEDNRALEEQAKDQSVHLSQMDEEVSRSKCSTAQLRCVDRLCCFLIRSQRVVDIWLS